MPRYNVAYEDAHGNTRLYNVFSTSKETAELSLLQFKKRYIHPGTAKLPLTFKGSLEEYFGYSNPRIVEI